MPEEGPQGGRSIKTGDFDMVMGINSRRQLAVAQKVMNARIVGKLMDRRGYRHGP